MSTSTGVEGARIHQCQGMLFPRSPREICEVIGLNWLSALKLSAHGWLAFSPESLLQLDERQETELRFVGALVVAGCDDVLLHRLLGDLQKPYCYRPDRVYYDWVAREWRLLPKPLDDAESVFGAWLDALEEDGNLSRLVDIQEQTEGAIKRVTGH